jgi:hypothetical protein
MTATDNRRDTADGLGGPAGPERATYRDRLDALAEALIRDETLDEPQAYAAAGLKPPAHAATAPEAPSPTLSGAGAR